jgi:hypothetical protein
VLPATSFWEPFSTAILLSPFLSHILWITLRIPQFACDLSSIWALKERERSQKALLSSRGMPDALVPLPTAASFSYIGAQSIWRYPSRGQSSPHSPPPRDREDRIEWKIKLVSKLKGRFRSNYARFEYVPKPIAGNFQPRRFNLRISITRHLLCTQPIVVARSREPDPSSSTRQPSEEASIHPVST